MPKHDLRCLFIEFDFCTEFCLLRLRRATKPLAGSLGWVDCSLNTLNDDIGFATFALAGEDMVNRLSLCSLCSPTFNSSDTIENLLPPGVGPKSSLKFVSCFLTSSMPPTSGFKGLMIPCPTVSVGS